MNKLFYGDNLEVLRKYIKDETVDLCYIDPPFNSKRNYNQIYNNIGKEDTAQSQAFLDTWTWDDYANLGLREIQENYLGHFTTQSIDLINGLTKVLGKGSLLAYLVNMTLRIAEIYRVLKSTGSFYLHCDPTASHYLKLIIDGIFCSQGGNFQNEIIWSYKKWAVAEKSFSRNHDIILFYSKNEKKSLFNVLLQERAASTLKRFGNKKIVSGHNENGKRVPSQTTDEDSKGVKMSDVWEIPIIAPSSKERLGYPTQKPEALLERIIKASSNENDLILDAFCGCGTSIAVAQRLNRKWIGIDITYQSISLILKRLEDSFGKEILDIIELNGIPKDINSAIALANKKDDRTRKEFEKWAVLTYSNNRAVINNKKGKDQGIDGIAYFQGDNDEPEKIILQVKSGKVKSGDIRDLQGTLTLQNGEIGIFITLQEPTKDMIQTAKMAGIYQSKFMAQPCDKIQIITVKDIIENQKRLDIRLSFEVLKSAEKQQQIKSNQMKLEIEI